MTRFFIMLAVFALSTALVQAEVTTQAVEYVHEGVTLKGVLAHDSALTDKRPGVLVVHEWWGLNDYAIGRAKMLAGLGYVALAVDMYGNAIQVDTPNQASALAGPIRNNRALMRGRIQAALATLRAQPGVEATKIAAIGYCFGGTTVLELARSGSDVLGVVSFHGALDAPVPAQAGDIKARVLVLHGADDPFIAKDELDGFVKEMQSSGADWQLVSYGNTVHSFTNPDVDRHQIPGAKYDALADARSWLAMRLFFNELFAGDSAIIKQGPLTPCFCPQGCACAH